MKNNKSLIALLILATINLVAISAGIGFWQGIKYNQHQTQKTADAVQAAVKAVTLAPVAAVPKNQ